MGGGNCGYDLNFGLLALVVGDAVFAIWEQFAISLFTMRICLLDIPASQVVQGYFSCVPSKRSRPHRVYAYIPDQSS